MAPRTSNTQRQHARQRKAELPPLSSTWIRYLLGFSVSVGVGLAPYLGRVKVPLFTPLLSLIPLSLQDIAIPIASAAMGLIAVLVQWRKDRATSGWVFGTVLGSAVAALLMFAAIETTAVAHIEVPAVGSRVAFVVGFSNLDKPPCVGLSKSACITTKLNLDEDLIDSHFGETQTDVAKFALVSTYVAFMSLFGLTVGLLVIRDFEVKKVDAAEI